jgi:hypothetical protein
MGRVRIGAVAMATALAGCASNISDDYRAGATATGIAAGSITYNGALGSRSLALKNDETGAVTHVRVGTSNTLNPFAQPEMDDRLGQVGGTFAVALPPGRYTVGSWQIRQGPGTLTSMQPVGLPFIVDTGKVTYLGSFHFQDTARIGLGTRDAEVSLEDKSARDLPVLIERHRALATMPKAAALNPGSKFTGLGGGSALRFDLPVMVPIR